MYNEKNSSAIGQKKKYVKIKEVFSPPDIKLMPLETHPMGQGFPKLLCK